MHWSLAILLFIVSILTLNVLVDLQAHMKTEAQYSPETSRSGKATKKLVA